MNKPKMLDALDALEKEMKAFRANIESDWCPTAIDGCPTLVFGLNTCGVKLILASIDKYNI
jgi:hypothetical protein